jgi:predicted regulator of Ras-like GTPase activity (Roadblock/LC7/MglB family)
VSLDDALRRARAGVDGARGAWLVGLDGVTVAGDGEDGLPGELLAAAHVEVFRRALAAGAEADLAPVSAMTLDGASGAVLLESVSEDLALVALLRPRTLVGRARYQLRLAAVALRDALDR